MPTEAQREAVKAYLNGGDWTIVGEFTRSSHHATTTDRGPNAVKPTAALN